MDPTHGLNYVFRAGPVHGPQMEVAKGSTFEPVRASIRAELHHLVVYEYCHNSLFFNSLDTTGPACLNVFHTF